MMIKMIEAYIKDKEFSWSEKTRESVLCTLRAVSPHLTGDPKELWKHLEKTQKPYSRVTTWKRVCCFWDFAMPNSNNPYRAFREKNRLQFRDKYVKRPASETLKSAKKKIESISDPAIRRKALELLYTGMRWTESFTIKKGFIKGKGGTERQVFLPEVEGPEFTGHYRTFLRALLHVGLKTHTLRKIYLTECVNNGANVFELKQIAGWQSLDSATSYIGVTQNRLKEISDTIRKKGR